LRAHCAFEADGTFRAFAASHITEILGFGQTAARGIKSGIVINMGEAEKAIRQAVSKAEREAAVQVEDVIVCVSAGRLQSDSWHAEVKLHANRVEEADLYHVLEVASRHTVGEGRVVLHSLPIGFSLDSAKGITEPRGMLGEKLGVDMHMVTMDGFVARNLMLCVERCHLNVEAMVASPFAAGLSILNEDELDIGTVCIDMGAGTTSFAVFSNGHLIHTDSLALGGHHITLDIARGLSVTMAEAERLKCLYGGLVVCKSDEREQMRLWHAGEDERADISRADLINIIRPRMDEILELVRDRLNSSPAAGEAGKHVVMTGGASQLTGLTDIAAQVLGRQVRLGRPLGVANLPQEAKAPAFAALSGLALYPQFAGQEHFERATVRFKMTGTGGYLGKMAEWVRESF
jgi:cell division protein FtsA